MRVDVKTFLLEEAHVPIVDVRSPGEYADGHIADAINLPLFTDDERAIVGTIYTKTGKAEAIEEGLEIVGPKMSTLAKKARALANNKKLKVHCWRGGMRSEKVAWLFELIGLEIIILEGGYKAYRQQLLEDFRDVDKFIVLQGPTGSGKTEILHKLQEKGEQILDLEKRANHKGSAFGALGMDDQPSTSQFQNLLYADLLKLEWSKRIWIESESLSIGKVYLPETLWENMNQSNVIELQIDRLSRAKRVVREYGHFGEDLLSSSIEKIKSRFGGNRVKEALELLKEHKLEQVALLLLDYYDKAYTFSKNKYKKRAVAIMKSENDDAAKNATKLIEMANNLNL